MSGGIPFMDILIFAIIAVFLGLRLRSVLGKRSGFEQDFNNQDSTDQQEPMTSAGDHRPADGSGIDAVKNADASFDAEDFLGGAREAYSMILSAFAEGDTDTLKPLLGYEMQASFAEAIRQRDKAGETLSITLAEMENAEIADAEVKDGIVSLTVVFTSRQIRVLKAEDGSILDGDTETEETLTDRWVFERDISSRDPNWLLVETETE